MLILIINNIQKMHDYNYRYPGGPEPNPDTLEAIEYEELH